MAKGLVRSELQRFAALGAAARLEELERERTAILKAFPGLRRASREVAAEHAAGPSVGGKRRVMSAQQRRAVSARMKKYWAARRREKAASK